MVDAGCCSTRRRGRRTMRRTQFRVLRHKGTTPPYEPTLVQDGSWYNPRRKPLTHTACSCNFVTHARLEERAPVPSLDGWIRGAASWEGTGRSWLERGGHVALAGRRPPAVAAQTGAQMAETLRAPCCACGRCWRGRPLLPCFVSCREAPRWL